MLFFLRKLIEALMLPIGLSGLLIIAAIAFRRRWLAAAGAALLYVFSIPYTGRAIVRQLEEVYPPLSVESCPSADAIVVLSASNVRGVSAAGVQWGETSNRYFAGFDLAMAGKARFLVFTLGPAEAGFSEGALERATAIRQGVPSDHILLTSRVQTTEDEAREVSAMAGIHSVVLVTSASHMPRAAFLFRSHGLSVSPFPTDQRILGRLKFSPQQLIPSAKDLTLSESALREYYGLAVYRTLFFLRLR